MVQGKARVLIVADGCYRGNKAINLKALADQAVELCVQGGSPVDHVLVVEHLKRVTVPEGCQQFSVKMDPKRDTVWDINAVDGNQPPEKVCPVEWVDAEDPLFVLYTS
jgi:acetyl-CoA synthetase